MIRRSLLAGLFSLLAVGMFGCNSSRGIIGGRGTFEQQQAMASLHDPFPDPDAGPEIEGARPREFDIPHAEERRQRWFRDTWWGY